MTVAASVGPFAALDHRFDVTAPAELARVLDGVLAPLADPSATARVAGQPIERIEVVERAAGTYLVSVDGVRASEAQQPARLVAGLLEHVNRRAAGSVTEGIPVHGGAVFDPASGGTVVLAGPSGSGKSTLSAAAVMRGWGFVAEEVAVVDGTTQVVRPFRRPIGLRRAGAAAIGLDYPDDRWFEEVHPWAVPRERWADGAPLVGIAIVSRGDGVDTRVVRLAPAEALEALIGNVVVPDDARLAPVFRRLDRVVRRMPVVRIEFDRPADGVACLDDLLVGWRSA